MLKSQQHGGFEDGTVLSRNFIYCVFNNNFYIFFIYILNQNEVNQLIIECF